MSKGSGGARPTGRKRASARPSGAGEAPETSDESAIPFEEAIERLESIVDRLESGELALEDSLVAFEEGVALSRGCAKQLDSAERRIEELVSDGGELIARPFAPERAPGEED